MNRYQKQQEHRKLKMYTISVLCYSGTPKLDLSDWVQLNIWTSKMRISSVRLWNCVSRYRKCWYWVSGYQLMHAICFSIRMLKCPDIEAAGYWSKYPNRWIMLFDALRSGFLFMGYYCKLSYNRYQKQQQQQKLKMCTTRVLCYQTNQINCIAIRLTSCILFRVTVFI